MSEETKRRIIEAGAELVHKQGFNNTGLKDILRAAEVPKGSFYFYFDNKEAFGIEMVDYYGEHFRELVNEILKGTTSSPMERMRTFLGTFHGYFKAQGFTRGCPVGNLAQEMGDLSPAFRDKLREALDGMAAAFIYILTKAQQAGEISADLNIRETAIFVVEAWHGAIIRMKVTKDEEPLNIFNDFIFNRLLK